MFKNGILLVFGVLAATVSFSSNSFAVSQPEIFKEVVGGTISTDNQTAATTNNNDPHAWYYLGCVTTSDACHHEAEEHGYHQYRAVYDRHSCDHHRPYACYGAE